MSSIRSAPALCYTVAMERPITNSVEASGAAAAERAESGDFTLPSLRDLFKAIDEDPSLDDRVDWRGIGRKLRTWSDAAKSLSLGIEDFDLEGYREYRALVTSLLARVKPERWVEDQVYEAIDRFFADCVVADVHDGWGRAAALYETMTEGERERLRDALFLYIENEFIFTDLGLGTNYGELRNMPQWDFIRKLGLEDDFDRLFPS